MRSYVDLCLFVRFIELSEERLGTYRSDMPETEILALWQKHESTMPSYVFHELYHFWQGLRLPFVHRYANRTLRGFPATVRWLKEEGVDLIAFETAGSPFGCFCPLSVRRSQQAILRAVLPNSLN